MIRYREQVEKMIKFLTVAAKHSRKAERSPLPAAGCFKNRLFRYGDQCGFTLVEAMISVAIISFGFAGLYAFIAASESSLASSRARQKMNIQGSEIFEVIKSDLDNIDSYKVDLTLAPAASIGTGTHAYNRREDWNGRIEEKFGAAGKGDTRKIEVSEEKTDPVTDKKYRIVTVFFETGVKNARGEKRVVFKRVFNAD